MKNFVSNSISNQIIPFNMFSNVTQLTAYLILTKLGVQGSIVTLILLFL